MNLIIFVIPFVIWYLYEVYKFHQLKKDSARVSEFLFENYNLPTTIFQDIYHEDRGLTYNIRKRIEEELFELGFAYSFLHRCSGSHRNNMIHKSYSEWKRLGYIK